MRNIKLAALALALVCGSIGAYGKYKKMFAVYYVAPMNSVASSNFTIAAFPPSFNCSTSSGIYVCTLSAEAGHNPGDIVPSQDVTILSIYN